jgi:hypothetical protein
VVKGVRVIVIILLAAAVVGCSRYIESRDPVRSLPDASPVPINLTARLDNGSITISWEVADSADIARFRVYVADSSGIDYTPWDSTTGYSMTLGGLKINQRYFLKVATVANSGLESELSEAVTARVIYLSIMIQSDREYTNSRDVQVQISCPSEETSHLMLSEDSMFSDAVFVSFVSTETSFRLSEGDGVKMVYARLQFVDGTQSGELLSDDIILDTRARIDSVFFTPVGDTFSSGETVTFGLDAGETGGEASVAFTGVEEVLLFDNGANGDLHARDGIYSGYWVIPPNFTLNDGNVTGSFTDAAGNGAIQITAQQPLNVNNPPDSVELFVVAEPEMTARLIWTVSEEYDFDHYRVFASDTAGAYPPPDKVIALINDQSTNTYSYSCQVADSGRYYFQVFVYDEHGASAGSNVDSAYLRPPPEVEP